MTERQLLVAVRDACRWGALWRELKSSRGRLTPEQVRWLDRLTEAGADVQAGTGLCGTCEMGTS